MKVQVIPDQPQIDVSSPEIVQVQTDGQTLWVNVNGVCMFRACKIGVLTIEDQRKPFVEGVVNPAPPMKSLGTYDEG